MNAFRERASHSRVERAPIVAVAAATGACVLAAVAGCANASGRSAASATGPVGVLTGTVRTYGGPEIGGTPAANGRPNIGVVVRFQRDGRPAGTATTGATGRFTVSLPAGDYGVDPCGAGKATEQVTVNASATTEAAFRCDVP
jgi:hypothetical protein